MEHMFDRLYKQANLQSMCSVTSLAVQPECQHDSAKLGASCSPPPAKGPGPGALASWEPRASCSQRHLWPPQEPLQGFSSWGSASPSQRGGKGKKKKAVSGRFGALV